MFLRSVSFRIKGVCAKEPTAPGDLRTIETSRRPSASAPASASATARSSPSSAHSSDDLPHPTAPATIVSSPRGKLMERRCRVGGVAFSSAAGGAAAAPRPRPPLDEGDDASDSVSASALAAAVSAAAATAAVSVEVVDVASGVLRVDCGERLTLKVSLEVSERFGAALPPPRPPPPRPPPPLPLPLPLPASTSLFFQPKV